MITDYQIRNLTIFRIYIRKMYGNSIFKYLEYFIKSFTNILKTLFIYLYTWADRRNHVCVRVCYGTTNWTSFFKNILMQKGKLPGKSNIYIFLKYLPITIYFLSDSSYPRTPTRILQPKKVYKIYIINYICCYKFKFETCRSLPMQCVKIEN